VLVCEADECKGAVLDLPLEAIGSTRGDPTNVDLAGATERGIPVLRAPGRNADAVAELTVGLLLAATRGIVGADRDVRAGEVYKGGSIPYQRFRGWQLAGRTAGIVGLGAVGRATAWRLEGLGMRVISADPFAPDATHSLDDVNSARAALHDLDALTDALVSGHLAAAALDHFEGEHIRSDHPLVGLDTVVLTPHIGGATYDTEANHTQLMADGLAALLRGESPPNLANPEVLSRG
jgi:D-3-phosphoglycerate dehydrogenase